MVEVKRVLVRPKHRKKHAVGPCVTCGQPVMSAQSKTKYCSTPCRRAVSRKPTREFTCKQCGGRFTTTLSRKAICGPQCRRKERRAKRVLLDLPKGTIGAISELVVCADLLRRGYEVFRSVTPNCSCDLAILKNGKLLRVEVRSGYLHPSGNKSVVTNRKHRADILAVSCDDGSDILYEPDLSGLGATQAHDDDSRHCLPVANQLEAQRALPGK